MDECGRMFATSAQGRCIVGLGVHSRRAGGVGRRSGRSQRKETRWRISFFGVSCNAVPAHPVPVEPTVPTKQAGAHLPRARTSRGVLSSPSRGAAVAAAAEPFSKLRRCAALRCCLPALHAAFSPSPSVLHVASASALSPCRSPSCRKRGPAVSLLLERRVQLLCQCPGR